MRARLLLLAALLATTLAAIAGPTSTPAQAAACPANATAENLIAMGRKLGPLATRFPPGVGFINEQGRACFGHRLLRFRAFVDDPGGIGGTSAYRITPSWLESPAIFIFTVDRSHGTDASAPFAGLYVPPRLGHPERRYLRSWVMIEANFVDAAARTCRATGVRGATPNLEQTIRICEAELVVVSIGSADSAPDTSTAPPAAEQADPWLVLIAMGGVIAASVARLLPGRRRQRR